MIPREEPLNRRKLLPICRALVKLHDRDISGGALRDWEPLDIGRGGRQPPKVIDEHIGIEDLQRFHCRSRRSATHLAASCISGRSAHIPKPIGSKVSSALTCGR
jgi:hypothetical protein